jgi:excisionase family DNA binding protein
VDEQLWGPKELAHHLGVCRRTAVKRMADGTLPGFRIGKLWRIRPQDARAANLRFEPADRV